MLLFFAALLLTQGCTHLVKSACYIVHGRLEGESKQQSADLAICKHNMVDLTTPMERSVNQEQLQYLLKNVVIITQD